MNYQGAKKLGAITILAFLFYLFITSGLAYAQTAEQYFQEGKADLEDFLLDSQGLMNIGFFRILTLIMGMCSYLKDFSIC